MPRMVRKQIYIEQRQQVQRKRAAKARGLSEAELIRQAIDQHLAGGTQGLPRDPEAWQRALALMRSLQAEGPMPDRSRNWTRDELYEERERPQVAGGSGDSSLRSE
jgi:hypothetical protein